MARTLLYVMSMTLAGGDVVFTLLEILRFLFICLFVCFFFFVSFSFFFLFLLLNVDSSVRDGIC